MARKPIRSVYFTKLTLENIRSFSERQELNLAGNEQRPAQWTLILGDNGVGKTTLLQCLARMRPVFNLPSDENSGPTPGPVEPEFKGEESNDELNAYARAGSDMVAGMTAELSYGIPLNGKVTRRKGSISTWLEIARKNDRLERFEAGGDPSDENEELPEIEEPLVLAYGAGRHPKSGISERVITLGEVESLFKVESSLHDAEDLLYRLEFGSLINDKNARRRLDGLKRMLVEILPDLRHPEDIEILGPPISPSNSDSKGVRVATDYGKVHLSRLSLGYQTVVAWTLDIAWRLLERYPDSKEPLREPAIVIVDEIDLHLHPHWQRTIRSRLTGHFPNVQFIATAHSPLMAQSSLDGNLAVLRKHEDHTEILNDPTVIKEWRLDQVITSDLFGLGSARPYEVETKLARREQLANKKRPSTEEQRELKELDEFVDGLPVAESQDDDSAMEIIRRAAAALKNAG